MDLKQNYLLIQICYNKNNRINQINKIKANYIINYVIKHLYNNHKSFLILFNKLNNNKNKI